jgi:AraC-like DNA-binding protein
MPQTLISPLMAQVPAGHLAALVARLQAHGLGTACARALATAGLDAQALAQPEARLPRERQSAVLQALAQATGRGDLGFEMGLAVGIGRLSLAGALLASAASLGEALQRLAPGFALVTPGVRLQVTRSADGGLQARLDPAQPMPWTEACVVLEAVVVGAHRLMGFVRQQAATPCRILLSWPAPALPAHAARWRTLDGAQVRFDALAPPASALSALSALPALPPAATTADLPWALLCLDAAVADAPLPMADATVAAEAERACARRLAALQARQDLADWTRWLIHATEERQIGQDEAAALLGISTRTYSRLLAREGVRWGVLAREVRHAKACALLRQGLGQAAVAQRLGYADVANFNRAFRAAAGCAPGRWREAEAQAQAQVQADSAAPTPSAPV